MVKSRFIGAVVIAGMLMCGTAGAESVKGQMLTKNPSKTAQILMADFESGKRTKEIYTDPYVVKHNYETFEKYSSFAQPPSGPFTPAYKSKIEQIRVSDGGSVITVLLVARLTATDGREVLHPSASISFVNDAGKIYRQEAYYDPHFLQVESFNQEHLKMYSGLVPKK
jgi:hypothetical protein